MVTLLVAILLSSLDSSSGMGHRVVLSSKALLILLQCLSVPMCIKESIQGRKLTFLGRRQLATDLFFSVAKWENVGDQL